MMRFLDFLFPPRVDEAALRAVSTDAFLALIDPRLVPETRPGTIALLPFSNQCVRAALHEAKYRGSERAFTLLATALAEYLADLDEGFTKSYIVVPVPLGRARQKERGFNQVEEIARRALRDLDGPFVLDSTLLERVRDTESQVSLERQKREENIRGAFTASPRLRSAGLCNATIILIDDVITTGATLQAALDALQSAGARHIIPLALAH